MSQYEDSSVIDARISLRSQEANTRGAPPRAIKDDPFASLKGMGYSSHTSVFQAKVCSSGLSVQYHAFESRILPKSPIEYTCHKSQQGRPEVRHTSL